MILTNRTGREPLDDNRLAKLAPAIFAQAPASDRSDRYSFLPTIEAVKALRGAGWQPVFAAQSKSLDDTRSGVAKHVIRLRHGDAPMVGDSVPELVVLNAHDGASAFQLLAGLFRLVCGNGLIVADETFARMSIRHSNTSIGEVVEGSFRVISELPKIQGAVESFRATELSADEQNAFATAALSLRWEDDKKPIDAPALLTARRRDDAAPNLWSTYNRVQENLVRGGVRGKNTSGRRQRTRGIGSVHEDTRINRALWTLAEELRRIKTGEAVAS